MKKHVRRTAPILLAVVMLVLTAAPVFAEPPRRPLHPAVPPAATPTEEPPGIAARNFHAIGKGDHTDTTGIVVEQSGL